MQLEEEQNPKSRRKKTRKEGRGGANRQAEEQGPHTCAEDTQGVVTDAEWEGNSAAAVQRVDDAGAGQTGIASRNRGHDEDQQVSQQVESCIDHSSSGMEPRGFEASHINGSDASCSSSKSNTKGEDASMASGQGDKPQGKRTGADRQAQVKKHGMQNKDANARKAVHRHKQAVGRNGTRTSRHSADQEPNAAGSGKGSSSVRINKQGAQQGSASQTGPHEGTVRRAVVEYSNEDVKLEPDSEQGDAHGLRVGKQHEAAQKEVMCADAGDNEGADELRGRDNSDGGEHRHVDGDVDVRGSVPTRQGTLDGRVNIKQVVAELKGKVGMAKMKRIKRALKQAAALAVQSSGAAHTQDAADDDGGDETQWVACLGGPCVCTHVRPCVIDVATVGECLSFSRYKVLVCHSA
jgi:hypothetical protein